MLANPDAHGVIFTAYMHAIAKMIGLPVYHVMADSRTLTDEFDDRYFMDDFFGCIKSDRMILVACDDDEEIRILAEMSDIKNTTVHFFDAKAITGRKLGIPMRVHKKRIEELGTEDYMFSLVDRIAASLWQVFEGETNAEQYNPNT